MSLANMGKIFRSLKSQDLQIRPIYHHTEERTRSCVFLCLLAGHLTGHLRKALAPLTFTDEDRPVPQEPDATRTRNALTDTTGTFELPAAPTQTQKQEDPRKPGDLPV